MTEVVPRRESTKTSVKRTKFGKFTIADTRREFLCDLGHSDFSIHGDHIPKGGIYGDICQNVGIQSVLQSLFPGRFDISQGVLAGGRLNL